MSDMKVLYERDGICIHTSTSDMEEKVITGSLKMMREKDGEAFIEWHPHSPVSESVFLDQDWMVIGSTSTLRMSSDHDVKQSSGQHTTHVRQTTSRASSESSNGEELEVLSIVKSQPRASDIPEADATLAQYDLQFALAEVQSVKKVHAHLSWPFLIFSLKSDETLPVLYFHSGGMKEFWRLLQRFLCLSKAKYDASLYLVDDSVRAIRKSVHGLDYDEDDAANLTASMFGDAFTGAMGGLSRVTRFIRGALGNKNGLEERRPPSEKAVMGESVLGDNAGLECQSDQNGYEVVVKEPFSEEPLKTEYRMQPMTESEWRSFLDTEGRVCDVAAFKERVFAGGLEPELRQEVWKFLLGYYDYKATDSERTVHRQQKVEEYYTMKKQWSTMSEKQLDNFSALKERLHLIEKDVLRTDRSLAFFKNVEGRGLLLLKDILITYGMYNFDLGYVQGMSDLLSPIIIVMDDEVDAFWCFVGFMDRLGGQFAEDQLGMKNQLVQVSNLIKLLLPTFWAYLKLQESENVYFCFRWLLCRFKREFSIENTMKMWEVLWTNHMTEHFHLFVCLGILLQEQEEIMKRKLGFNDILKYINDLAGKIDVERTLMNADALYTRFQGLEHLSLSLQKLKKFTLDDSFQSAPTVEWSAEASAVIAGDT